ncbi:MAG TPA: oxygen-independent coproporphyrinogen III oxidase [Opitutaceae bacterium]
MIIPPEATAHADAALPSLDLDLIRKYAVPGPRYTSYPPATQFHTDLAAIDLDGAIAADSRPRTGGPAPEPAHPLSLYFHLPFCESRCWYCGCHTIITRRHDAADAYLDDIAREIELVSRRLDPARKVAQLHLGGGTPTFLTPEQLRRLAGMVRTTFSFADDAEISVEIDPRRVTAEHVEALRLLGVNRASLGVQDTNPAVQVAIHRIQPHETNIRTIEWLRGAGVDSINVDLIYGLPLQTPESLDRTINDVLELRPNRLSVFSYAHVPWIKPAQRIFDKMNQLPGPEQKLAMFGLMHTRLKAAGYVDIGLDHFARPDDELAHAQRAGSLHRNFQGYSTRAGASLYGFGISSISQTDEVYWQNHKSLADYRAALREGRLPVERGYRTTTEDRQRRTLIMRLMCDRRLDFAALGRLLGLDVPTTFARELASLEPLAADGLLQVGAAGVVVLPAGAPLLRVIAMKFDAFLQPGLRRHALTV